MKKTKHQKPSVCRPAEAGGRPQAKAPSNTFTNLRAENREALINNVWIRNVQKFFHEL